MLSGFLILLSFLLAGDVVGYLFALPLPGPVLGMALLLAWLAWHRRAPPENLRVASTGILQYLSLLFVPAGVGVILHLERLQREWPAILGAVLFGTLISVGLTGLLLKRIRTKREMQHD
ncbi:MAG: CidA/LrgA family protein [Formivibrio sp.]|nr:CidA/LrgA family protein [Formivibrio sp.]